MLKFSIVFLLVCWSPKGKQLAAGLQDGNVIQLGMDLKIKKVIGCPDIFIGQCNQVVSLHWISTFEFAVIYSSQALPDPNEMPPLSTLVIIHASKDGNVSITNFEDVFYGSGYNTYNFFIQSFPTWNVFIAASGNSVDTCVIGQSNANGVWEKWVSSENQRVEVPLGESGTDEYAVGIAVDYSSNMQISIKNDTATLPCCPVLILYSTDGCLIPFVVINEEIPMPKPSNPKTLPLPLAVPSTIPSTIPRSSLSTFTGGQGTSGIVPPPPHKSLGFPVSSLLSSTEVATTTKAVLSTSCRLTNFQIPKFDLNTSPSSPATTELTHSKSSMPVMLSHTSLTTGQLVVPQSTPINIPISLQSTPHAIPSTVMHFTPTNTPKLNQTNMIPCIVPQFTSPVTVPGPQSTVHNTVSLSTIIPQFPSPVTVNGPQSSVHTTVSLSTLQRSVSSTVSLSTPQPIPNSSLSPSSSKNLPQGHNVSIEQSLLQYICKVKVSTATADYEASFSPLISDEIDKFSDEINLLMESSAENVNMIESDDIFYHEIKNVGTLKELRNSIIKTSKDVQQSVVELNTDVEIFDKSMTKLNDEILKSISLAEEARIRLIKSSDVHHRKLCEIQPLDPYNARKVNDIRARFAQIDQQLRDINNQLDNELEQRNNLSRLGGKKPMKTPSIQNYYCILRQHRQIIKFQVR
jgi:nuclear pore complex protein Nup214